MASLSNEDKQLIDRIKAQLRLVADVSRAEALLYGPLVEGRTTVLAHSHPNSVAPAYLKNYSGQQVGAQDMAVVINALRYRRKQRGYQGAYGTGGNVAVEAWPIVSPGRPRQVIGAVSIDTSLLERERQRRRSRPFRQAVRRLNVMLTRGLVGNAQNLSPIGESEGFMVVSPEGHIRYTSGVATNLYRRLGYLDSLLGRHLETLATHDKTLFSQAAASLHCLERETEDGGRYWVRKAIPLLALPGAKEFLLRRFLRPATPGKLSGVLLVVRDITEDRRKEQEMRVKNAMIQEIHHRVKNNLQTIAALLRIQSRRIESEAATVALKDAIKRILSVAVIHEFLSDQETWTINIKEVCQRIITQTVQGIVWPEDNIRFQLHGPPIWLPARQATACALVINELLQNALEHGFEHEKQGAVSITLTDEGDHVIITISDDGPGLPDDFDLAAPDSLGLQIASTLVIEDLQGALTLTNNNGTTAKITFPKAIFGGEQGWNRNALS
ncbi:MAG: sensor histidine kinase [Anaerolineae bacterium]